MPAACGKASSLHDRKREAIEHAVLGLVVIHIDESSLASGKEDCILKTVCDRPAVRLSAKAQVIRGLEWTKVLGRDEVYMAWIHAGFLFWGTIRADLRYIREFDV